MSGSQWPRTIGLVVATTVGALVEHPGQPPTLVIPLRRVVVPPKSLIEIGEKHTTRSSTRSSSSSSSRSSSLRAASSTTSSRAPSDPWRNFFSKEPHEESAIVDADGTIAPLLSSETSIDQGRPAPGDQSGGAGDSISAVSSVSEAGTTTTGRSSGGTPGIGADEVEDDVGVQQSGDSLDVGPPRGGGANRRAVISTAELKALRQYHAVNRDRILRAGGTRTKRALEYISDMHTNAVTRLQNLYNSQYVGAVGVGTIMGSGYYVQAGNGTRCGLLQGVCIWGGGLEFVNELWGDGEMSTS